jgi:hypothetical protein
MHPLAIKRESANYLRAIHRPDKHIARLGRVGVVGMCGSIRLAAKQDVKAPAIAARLDHHPVATVYLPNPFEGCEWVFLLLAGECEGRITRQRDSCFAGIRPKHRYFNRASRT